MVNSKQKRPSQILINNLVPHVVHDNFSKLQNWDNEKHENSIEVLSIRPHASVYPPGICDIPII